MPEARRITGPHLLIDGPGAAIELTDADPERVRKRALEALAALGWPAVVEVRRHRSGSTLALRAPPDLLYTACMLLEWAATHEERAGPAWNAVLRERDEEANPRLRACLATAPWPAFSDDDYGLTLGLGRHSQTWPLDELPDPDDLPSLDGLPIVFITGTNGKTTVTRMLTRIALAGGHTPGWTSSDAYGVGKQVVATGDWTGPGAARRVLRLPQIDFACLETARGGLLRRGLVIGGAKAAIVTNVSSDHLGEYGIHDVSEMARAKLGVAVGLAPGGTLVVNACDPWLREAVPSVLARRPDLRIAWFADGPVDIAVAAQATETELVFGEHRLPLDDIPLTFGGTARHNVQNALAAGLAALAAGLSPADVAAGLGAIRPSVAESRGRMNRFILPNGAIVLVDFAHNPAGVTQIGKTTAKWPARRRLLLLGQAGDRTDGDLRDLAAVVAQLAPDRVVLKEMPEYLRGRAPGETVGHLAEGLVDEGFPADRIDRFGSEAAAVDALIEGAAPGDLLLLLVHAHVDDTVAKLQRAGAVPG